LTGAEVNFRQQRKIMPRSCMMLHRSTVIICAYHVTRVGPITIG